MAVAKRQRALYQCHLRKQARLYPPARQTYPKLQLIV